MYPWCQRFYSLFQVWISYLKNLFKPGNESKNFLRLFDKVTYSAFHTTTFLSSQSYINLHFSYELAVLLRNNHDWPETPGDYLCTALHVSTTSKVIHLKHIYSSFHIVLSIYLCRNTDISSIETAVNGYTKICSKLTYTELRQWKRLLLVWFHCV